MTFHRLSRALGGALAIGVVAVPAMLVANAPQALVAQLQASPVQTAKVAYPVTGSRVTDLRTYGVHPGTEIKAPCNRVVRAATPGTAYVSASKSGGNHVVHVISSPGQVVTWYGYMRSSTVQTGQYVKAGQQVGTVGHQGRARTCSLYFAVNSGPSGARIAPSAWLRRYVGKTVPTSWLAPPDASFNMASFNTLGASHTVNSKAFAGYASRVPRQVTMLNGYKLDVVGLQEFQQKQRALFLSITQGTYGIYPTSSTGDSDNSIIWRNSTFEFVDATTMAIPYFKGGIRQMPVVQLRERSTGLTAYFMNVHNPASLAQYGDQSMWRAKGIAIERAKVTELLQTGRPVFFTGDFNDRANAYCPVTADGLMIAGNTVTPTTATSCTVPDHPWIDWIFAAGPMLFESYTVDTTPKVLKISDHPIVLARVAITQ